MQSSVPPYGPDCASNGTAALPPPIRNAFRAQIAIHRLIFLAALAFLPLLTWHQSTSYLFEKIDMSNDWKDKFEKLQAPGWRTGLWVPVWILAAVDILHALWCIGWYQELLHPGTGRTRRNEGNKRSDDSSSETETQRPAASTTAHIDKRQASMYPGRTTPRSFHPLLQPVILPSVRTVLLILYDAILIAVLALHIYSFLHLINRRVRLCYINLDGKNEPRAADPPIAGTNKVDDKMIAGCQWLNASITSAGGVASAVAAILAATHVAALVCRLYAACSVWYTALKSKIQSKNRASPKQDAEPEWHCSPRHVDIQTRYVPASGTAGRLTQISEEEHDAGGVARRRHHRSKSGQSGTSKASSTKLENVLLECLVP